MDKEEMKELIRAGDINPVLENDQLRVIFFNVFISKSFLQIFVNIVETTRSWQRFQRLPRG
jgi:hypothetical protein